MTNIEFESILKKYNLTKKEFASLCDLPYQTLMNWKQSDKTPSWVKSWLENYIKAQSYEELKNKVFEIENIK
ncbi:XRE family transcriptional regulator [Campylobacter sp. IFREMER_LSEM_CL1904]|uniref:XRE family transcriptional regulator n=1 Tax=unclassified Campylobacter TaxID=2593542 RepID=UPI0021E67271|nr:MULTISPECIES: XRE family transcriptional regulator [unclassified Campylobacter]MCV3428228.1 XRE family transcriptional regulator [Campylobacter sp. IFREMER_LSEM_CL1904]MCV3479974.1 XRE family transcriptional regulator [Campylobacter sp. CNRCH_2015_1657]